MRRVNTPPLFFMDKNDELLISHDELVTVAQTMMEIILRAGLQKKLDVKLKESGVQPGFAERANNIEKIFHRERLMLMASGAIK